MNQRIVIRHISGTRIHQADEFAVDTLRAICAGRGEEANVRFDPQREDMVSREHLRIVAQGSGGDNFLLSDLNSRNGTFLNRQRIQQPVSIRHNDVVQLGPNGPEFRFELDPPPANVSKPTRLMDGVDSAAQLRPLTTREVAIGEISSRPIGRATVERMLGDTFGKVKRESNKTLWIGVAALVAVCLVGVVTLYTLHSSSDASASKAQQQQQLLMQLAQIARQPRAADPAENARIDQMNAQLAKLVAENRQLVANRAGSAASTSQPAAQGGANPQAAATASYDSTFAKAADAYRSGDSSTAYADALTLINEDGNRYEAYFLAGLCLSAMQRQGDAVPAFQYALQVAPEAAKKGIEEKLSEAQNAMQQPASQ
jgi:hypothetical protein